mgnify:CR=1 FL=1
MKTAHLIFCKGLAEFDCPLKVRQSFLFPALVPEADTKFCLRLRHIGKGTASRFCCRADFIGIVQCLCRIVAPGRSLAPGRSNSLFVTLPLFIY